MDTFKSGCLLTMIKIQAFNEADIIGMLSPEILKEIKQKDEHPFFQVYSVCHEGVSTPKLLNEQNARPIRWLRNAVQSIKNIVLKGVKLFKGHNKDNSTNDREPLGEVIQSFEKEIDGKLHHIAITYHPKEKIEEVKKYDVCSQEGIWNFIDSAGELLADSVEKITGIALANSKEQTPAFAEAKRIGFVQCFESDDLNKKGDNKMSDQIIKKEITFTDVKEFIESRGIIPSRLYMLEDIKQDKIFSKEFVELENKITTKDNENKALSGKLLQYEKDLQKTSAGNRLDLFSKELQLTDKQKAHVKKIFDEDLKKNEVEDFTDDGLKKYIKVQSKAYANAIAELPGNKQPANDKTDKLESGDDQTKKENNPLLEEDINLEDINGG